MIEKTHQEVVDTSLTTMEQEYLSWKIIDVLGEVLGNDVRSLAILKQTQDLHPAELAHYLESNLTPEELQYLYQRLQSINSELTPSNI